MSFLGSSLGLLVLAALGMTLYLVNRSDKNQIDFTDLFINKKTGKLGGSEFRINIAFLLTSWALVFLTIQGSLTEWFLGAYLAAFVADRMFSRNKNVEIERVKDPVEEIK